MSSFVVGRPVPLFRPRRSVVEQQHTSQRDAAAHQCGGIRHLAQDHDAQQAGEEQRQHRVVADLRGALRLGERHRPRHIGDGTGEHAQQEHIDVLYGRSRCQLPKGCG